MCGIVGICGNQPVAPLVVELLKLMEYRGYDSTGVAIMHAGALAVNKDIGKIDDVAAKYRLASLAGSTAIGHVRWATHGAVTQGNAHPHCDCSGQVAVVHNGIVENYQELKHQLVARGHRFVSETDTEVIPHLLEEQLKRGLLLESAVAAVAPQLAGSYALLALSSCDPCKIVGTRNGSPLVVGKNGKYIFAASDALAFSKYVEQIYSLGDREIAILTATDARFLDETGRSIAKLARHRENRWNDIGKNGHRHFMLKEIMEQPETIADTLVQDKALFAEIANDIHQARQVVITACGTSRYAALIGRYYLSRIGRKFCDVVMASEFQYFAESIDSQTLVISVSQSGETADVLEGVKKAKAAGARVISIINRPQSLLAEISDRIIYLNCGPEVGVAATKSFLSQLLILYLLASATAGEFEKAVISLKTIGFEISRVIEWNNEQLGELSQKLKPGNDLYCIARGINFAIASEAALKLKEIAYIHAEGMPAGELKHGTLALIAPGVPVAVICPNDYTFHETINNAMEAKSRGAYIIGVSNVYNEIFDFWVRIPDVAELLYPLVTVVPFQLLAYHLAISKGYDPDHPRNLAKSVTVV